jgi:hypothetical protein
MSNSEILMAVTFIAFVVYAVSILLVVLKYKNDHNENDTRR